MSSFLLKIVLRETSCPTWRRFVAPSFTTLDRLHYVIQTVMGWDGACAHCYGLRKQEYYPGNDPLKRGFAEEMFSLDDLAFQTGTKLKYCYDPEGANWKHDISVESTRFVGRICSAPFYCIDGENSVPQTAGIIQIPAKRFRDHADADEQDSSAIGLASKSFDLEKINRLLHVEPSEISKLLREAEIWKRSLDNSILSIASVRPKTAS